MKETHRVKKFKLTLDLVTNLYTHISTFEKYLFRLRIPVEPKHYAKGIPGELNIPEKKVSPCFCGIFYCKST